MAMTMIAIARGAGLGASLPVRTIVDIADSLTADAHQRTVGEGREWLARVGQTT
jgi:hypothetical protein